MTIWENAIWNALKESLIEKSNIFYIFQYKTDLTKATLFRLNIGFISKSGNFMNYGVRNHCSCADKVYLGQYMLKRRCPLTIESPYNVCGRHWYEVLNGIPYIIKLSRKANHCYRETDVKMCDIVWHRVSCFNASWQITFHWILLLIGEGLAWLSKNSLNEWRICLWSFSI